MTDYPYSRVVVMALTPSGLHSAPFFGDGPSPSAARMRSLVPDWRDRALGVNAWPSKRDYEAGRPSNVESILRQTQCEIIIALGREVTRWLSTPPGPFYSWQTLKRAPDWRSIDVLLFPHPSGLNRHWNDPANVRRARESLQDALDAN